MVKQLVLLSVGLLFVVVGGTGAAWYLAGQALYEPGQIRAVCGLAAPPAPPPQTEDGDGWWVEPGVRLQHERQGAGPELLPSARLVVLEDGDHFALQRAQDNLGELIAAFFRNSSR